MCELNALIKRNTKLFFKDKGLFFTSLVTPMILLLLYITFLGKVYRDAFESVINGIGIKIPDKLIDACVGGQLMSSLLAVCCVTVAFCSNMLMVNDKINGTIYDLKITPVKSSVMALGYYISTLISTLIVCFSAAAVCFIYLAVVGWYLNISDVFLLLFDVFLLVMFGTALSSIINLYLTSQGQISAVGTIVSAGYGFICGAYMPISQFSETLQKIISLLPGTYGTALLRNHAMQSAFREMADIGVQTEIIDGIKSSVDANIDFFGTTVKEPMMHIVLGGTVIILVGLYILLHSLRAKKKRVK
ncbi:MAG: ABC transporter permease [Clostridia bacterium]|nr:ABC transporter permease [Clostridia bacterium]MBO5912664.1 ABC transporter permease [Clostridia bacterium]